jgi:hypothetical protein
MQTSGFATPIRMCLRLTLTSCRREVAIWVSGSRLSLAQQLEVDLILEGAKVLFAEELPNADSVAEKTTIPDARDA